MKIETAYYSILLGNGEIKHLTKREAEAYFLDYVNNFITVSRFASFYGITYQSVNGLINKVRSCK